MEKMRPESFGQETEGQETATGIKGKLARLKPVSRIRAEATGRARSADEPLADRSPEEIERRREFEENRELKPRTLELRFHPSGIGSELQVTIRYGRSRTIVGPDEVAKNDGYYLTVMDRLQSALGKDWMIDERGGGSSGQLNRLECFRRPSPVAAGDARPSHEPRIGLREVEEVAKVLETVARDLGPDAKVTFVPPPGEAGERYKSDVL